MISWTANSRNGWKQLDAPDWRRDLSGDPETRRQSVVRRIKAETGITERSIAVWSTRSTTAPAPIP